MTDSDTKRSNAAAIAWDGTAKYAGDVYANYNFATKTGEKLATESYVNEHSGGGSGGGGDMSAYALKKDTVLDTTLSIGRKANTTVGNKSIALGNSVTASGDFSAAFGWASTAEKDASFAEGYGTIARGKYSHAEGANTIAWVGASHAEGSGTKAQGTGSHAEGAGVWAVGDASHAEGDHTEAHGYAAHTEGGGTYTDAYYAHAEGYYTTAKGIGSHTEGRYTKATGDYQHVSGVYNIEDATVPNWTEGTSYSKNDIVKYTDEKYYACIVDASSTTWNAAEWKKVNYSGKHAVIVGNGADSNTRSNAAAITWDGTGKFAGDLYANYDFANGTGEKLATEAYVNEHGGGGGGSSDEYALKKDTVL